MISFNCRFKIEGSFEDILNHLFTYESLKASINPEDFRDKLEKSHYRLEPYEGRAHNLYFTITKIKKDSYELKQYYT